MKLKITVLTLLLVLCTNIFSAAPKADVPQIVVDAFKAQYPAAIGAKWEKEEDGTYEVDFILNKNKLEATYTAVGSWIQTETEIAVKSLPAAIATAFATKFPKAKIKEAAKVEKPTGVFYEIEYKEGRAKKEALFDINGNYLSDDEDDDSDENSDDKPDEERTEDQETGDSEE